MANSSPAIAAVALHKRYRKGAVAVAGIDVTVEPGEQLGLLGPNGAGKSTFVKMVCGLVRPTAGTLEVFGAPAGSHAARTGLGYLAELFRFPSWLTADEVLVLHQRLVGSAGGSAERAKLLDEVGLDAAELTTRKVGEFSKGMQQRLGIAQTLVGSPRLVLLDEPTSALDPAGRQLVRELVGRLREREIAVVLNSHLLGEVEKSCDRVLIMKGGTIIRSGSPRELTDELGVEVELATGVRTFADARRDDVPELVRTLVAGGEQVYRVTPRRSTLEEAYLEALEETS